MNDFEIVDLLSPASNIRASAWPDSLPVVVAIKNVGSQRPALLVVSYNLVNGQGLNTDNITGDDVPLPGAVKIISLRVPLPPPSAQEQQVTIFVGIRSPGSTSRTFNVSLVSRAAPITLPYTLDFDQPQCDSADRSSTVWRRNTTALWCIAEADYETSIPFVGRLRLDSFSFSGNRSLTMDCSPRSLNGAVINFFTLNLNLQQQDVSRDALFLSFSKYFARVMVLKR
jgi:hypothetical protein